MGLEEDLQILDVRLSQLKLDYEQYFLGSRPREPIAPRREVERKIVQLVNNPIQNTAQRFKFNSINSRYQAFKRKWDQTLREIEAGTYQRHRFKANLKQRTVSSPPTGAPAHAGGKPAKGIDALFQAYQKAASSCGQDTAGLTREKLAGVVKRQQTALKEKLGCERVSFRVTVEDGRVRVKATPK